ncbi:F-box protein At3g07870-like [Cornus florida]|uniref:F-box protein At3g07870-like n=1 Tax=Cornus florida TaxID=4283 RepID=UPI0028A26FE8|nr:F-box protein At3g07870-like [Cornus florida]
MPFRCFRSLLLRRQSWRGREEEEEKESSVVDLPSSIAVDIEEEKESSVVDLPWVCKNWQYLILQDHPYFTKIRLSRPNLTTDIVFWGRDEEFFYLLDLSEVSNYVGPMRLRIKFNFSNLSIPHLENVGSCNGLICLNDSHNVYISNPILGECVALPKPIIESNPFGVRYLFGFSPTTGHYKVLRFIRNCTGYYSETEVYTLGTVTWRYVGRLLPPGQRAETVNLNGAIHWMTPGDKANKKIFSFDVAEEQIRLIPPPNFFTHNTYNRRMGLGVLGNCLCISFNSDNNYSCNGHYLDMWSMKEYGVAESWTKVRILRTSIPSGMEGSLAHHCLYPITLWKDGEILFESDLHILLSYNPKNGRFTALKVNYQKEKVEYTPRRAFTYSSSSFSSLKDVASTGGLRIVDVKSKQ